VNPSTRCPLEDSVCFTGKGGEMIQLQLNENERAILVELLETCISDLRVEITGTDSLDYKEMLKQKKEVLMKLQQALLIEQETAAMT
jgi:hypothetical protein